MNKLSVSVLCVTALVAPSLALPPIEQLAPNNSVLIIGVRDANEAVARFKATSLWDLWQSEEMKALVAEPLKEMDEGLKEFYEELGVEDGSLVPPTGSTGVAFFPVLDEDMGTTAPGFLLAADYGDDAEKMSELIDAAINKGLEDDQIEVDEEDVLGRTVRVLTFIEQEEAPEEEPADDEFDDMFMDEGMNGDDPFEQLMEKMYFVRHENAFLVTSSLDSMTSALEAVDGEAPDSISGSRGFQAVVNRLGTTDGYAVLLTENLLSMMGDDAQMMAMMAGSLRSIVGYVAGAGVGVRFDSPSAMVEQIWSVYMPEGRAGLTALLDTESPRGDLPSFIRSDAISYSRFNFEFSGVLDVIRTVMQANPMMPPDQVEAQMMQIEEPVRLFTSSFGVEVHNLMSVREPITLDSVQPLYAVELVNADNLREFMTQHGAAVGFVPREFLGHTIFTAEDDMLGMMLPIPIQGGALSVGLGTSFAFIGPAPAVEQALRAAGQADVATLDDVRPFERAVQPLSTEPVIGWGYTDIVAQLKVMKEMVRLQEQQWIEGMKQWDPDHAAEMQAELNRREKTAWEKFELDLLKNFIGPASWEARAVEDGFIGRSYILAPE